MKKVLVLAAAIALFATPALSAITGTKHDLSAYGGAGNELCVFCHTPHGGATGGIAPLWNRSQVSATNFYNSATLDAATSVASANLTDAPLCLSCHALDITDHQVAKTGVNMGALGTFVKCSDCHNVKSSASGAGINPTDPFVGDSGTEYLHNDISSHVFDVPNKSVAAETGMPVPYTNTCGVCHSGAGL